MGTYLSPLSLSKIMKVGGSGVKEMGKKSGMHNYISICRYVKELEIERCCVDATSGRRLFGNEYSYHTVTVSKI